MMVIPNIIDPSVPIGKDDSQNVEIENLVSRLFRILKFRIIQISWRTLTESTLTAQDVLPVMDFII